MFKIAIAALLSASVVGLAAPAQAVIYNYTISGIGSGTLDGAAFDNTAFTFTLVGDTTNLQSFGIEKVIDPLNAANFVIGASAGTLSIPTRLGTFSNGNGVYFSRSTAIGGADLFDFYLASTVDLDSNFGPINGYGVFALEQFQGVTTSAGLLSFNSARDVVFSNGGGTPGVPEPASWALMIAGFGLVGAAMRRRKLALTA
jgi:PEP-CTERM motif